MKAFKQAGSYSDAAEQILAARYAEGEAKRAAQDWDGAVKAFEQAGNYSDAAEQIRETRYLEGMTLLKNGSAAEAYAVLKSVEGYRDVTVLLNTDSRLIEAAAAREAKLAPYRETGNIVTFGNYPQTSGGKDSTAIEWIVLDYDAANDRALLVSRYGLDAQPYNTEYTAVTWGTCSLRGWLNGEFMERAFTSEEQGATVSTAVDNSTEQGYYSTSGGKNTEDRVFLLSYKEAWTYFGDDSARECAPTAYAVSQGAYKSSNGGSCWWWLRSPGTYQHYAAYVYNDGSLYSIHVNYFSGCVRPALWLDLTSDIF